METRRVGVSLFPSVSPPTRLRLEHASDISRARDIWQVFGLRSGRLCRFAYLPLPSQLSATSVSDDCVQSSGLIEVFVLPNRCGAAPDFHRIPSSPMMRQGPTLSTKGAPTYWGRGGLVNRYIGDAVFLISFALPVLSKRGLAPFHRRLQKPCAVKKGALAQAALNVPPPTTLTSRCGKGIEIPAASSFSLAPRVMSILSPRKSAAAQW